MNEVALIDKKLNFAVIDGQPPTVQDTQYLQCQDLYNYKAVNNDFGPYNLSQFHDFFVMINDKLIFCQQKQQILTCYCSSNPQVISNVLALICAYCVVHQHIDPQKIQNQLKALKHQPSPFRDISTGQCPFFLNTFDIMNAFHSAMKAKFYPSNFSSDNYNQLLLPQYGMISEVIKDKLFACPSPIDPSHVLYKSQPLAPEIFLKTFKQLKVSALVRLNDSYYQRNEFINNGIHHFDLNYPDGSVPKEELIQKFFQILDDEKIVVVHCMAGLGRTGTLICLELIRKYNFTAREAIAWTRICRQGSVSGQQQVFICSMEDKVKHNDFVIKKKSLIIKKVDVSEVRQDTTPRQIQKVNTEVQQQPERSTRGIVHKKQQRTISVSKFDNSLPPLKSKFQSRLK